MGQVNRWVYSQSLLVPAQQSLETPTHLRPTWSQVVTGRHHELRQAQLDNGGITALRLQRWVYSAGFKTLGLRRWV